jgi:hypothetical protein
VKRKNKTGKPPSLRASAVKNKRKRAEAAKSGKRTRCARCGKFYSKHHYCSAVKRKNSLIGRLFKRAAKSAFKRAKKAVYGPSKAPRKISWGKLTRGQRFKVAKDAGLAPAIATKISSMSWAALGRSNYRGWQNSLATKLGQRGTVLANPKRRRNGDLAGERTMYTKFHGRKPKTVTEVLEVESYDEDFAQLGKLTKLMFKTPTGKFEIAFTDQDKVELAANAEGTQLYFIGGNQDVRRYLSQWGVDARKDLVDLGVCTQIEYLSQKSFDKFHSINYYHRLGEETGVRPRLMFNQLNKRLALVGGAYEIKAEGIIN